MNIVFQKPKKKKKEEVEEYSDVIYMSTSQKQFILDLWNPKQEHSDIYKYEIWKIRAFAPNGRKKHWHSALFRREAENPNFG